MEFNSTYGLKRDWSFRAEEFYYIPLTWKLGVSRIEALKIRISKWYPKENRSNQAIFYFNAESKEGANEVLKQFQDFDFKALEKRFDELFDSTRMYRKCTGDTQKWLLEIIPQLRKEFINPKL